MTKPDVIQRQREILRTFRESSAQRASVETASEAQYSTERQSADYTRASALARAEEKRVTVEVDAQSRYKLEQTSAGAELSSVRETSDRHMAEVREAYKWSKATMDQAKLGSLMQEAEASEHAFDSGGNPSQELAGAAHDATRAAKYIPGLVVALAEAQQRTRRRQRKIAGGVILVIVIAAIIAGFVLL